MTGEMGNGGKPAVVFSGAFNFAARSASITSRAAPGMKSFSPYEVRFVDGWSYVEIAASVIRPPTLRADTRWIAFQGLPGQIPVPHQTLRGNYPYDVLSSPLTEPMLNVHFLDDSGSEPRRVQVRFAKGIFAASEFTFSVDATGRIVAFSSEDTSASAYSNALDFAYGSHGLTILAPSSGVQRLSRGEKLYPTTTTTTARTA